MYVRALQRGFLFKGEVVSVAVESYSLEQVAQEPAVESQLAVTGILRVVQAETDEIETTGGDSAKRAENVFNRYGVVLPPSFTECKGDNCPHKGSSGVCELTKHHLHSTASEYENDSKLASDFRDLASLQAWLYRCIHDDHHEEHEIHVPIPSPKTMRRAGDENASLKLLMANHRELQHNRQALNAPGLSARGIKVLNKKRVKYLKQKERLVEAAVSVEVIPEELVLGALLLVAPEVAKSRISKVTDFVLPALLIKNEIPVALANAQIALAAAA